MKKIKEIMKKNTIATFDDFAKDVSRSAFNKNDFESQSFDLDLTGYTAWEDRRGDIISEVYAGSPTLNDLMPMPGSIAGTTIKFPILDTTINLSDPCANPSTASNTTSLTPRLVTPALFWESEVLCPIKLKPILPMLTSSGSRQEDLGGLANAYIDIKKKRHSNLMEQVIWRSNTSTGSGSLAKIKGLIQIAKSETADLAHYATFSAFTVGAVANGIIETINTKRTTEMRYGKVTIYLSETYFDIARQTLIQTYGINPTGNFLNTGDENQSGVQMFKWPGTDTWIKAAPGLNTDNHIFATVENNLMYFPNLKTDEDDVRLNYNPYDNKVYYNLGYTFGVQYGLASQVIFLEKV